MSADNGVMLLPHPGPNGGYALVGYMASSERPVVARLDHTRFPTVEDALIEYANHTGYMGRYWSEYGLSIPQETVEYMVKEAGKNVTSN